MQDAATVAPWAPSTSISFHRVDGGRLDATTLSQISGTVWVDSDSDGILDSGEQLPQGSVGDLFDEFGDLVASVTTGQAGPHALADLRPGTSALVAVVLIAGGAALVVSRRSDVRETRRAGS